MSAQIQILSKGMIQNEMLAASIESATGLACECIGSLPASDEVNKAGRCVVLVDCLQFEGESLWASLNGSARHLGQGTDVILFNAQAGGGLESLALSRGVRGIFFRGQPLALLMRGIKAVLDGELWFPRRVMSECLRKSQAGIKAAPAKAGGRELLSAREREVLLLITQGLSNEELAARLCISLSTVKKHLCNIYGKLKLSNRIQAAFWAVQNLQN